MPFNKINGEIKINIGCETVRLLQAFQCMRDELFVNPVFEGNLFGRECLIPNAEGFTFEVTGQC